MADAMSAYFRCSICGRKIYGSPLINPIDAGQVGMIVAIHLIDEHWDIVERIRATTHDGDARIALNNQLIAEELVRRGVQ